MNADLISQSILNEIEDIVYISDPKTYELYYINRSLQKILGSPEEAQWRHQKCHKVLQGLDEPCPFCTNDLLTHDQFYNWSHYNALLGQHFYVQDKLVNFEGTEARLEIAKDVTTQKQLEETLVKRLEEQQLLFNCISLLHTTDSPHLSIHKLLGLVADYHKAERGYLFLLSEDGSTICNSHEWCAYGITPQIDNLQQIPASLVDRWFEKYAEVGEFYIDSLSGELDHNSEEYEILHMQGISSLVTAPLYNTDGTFMGFLGVDNPTQNMKNTTVIRAVSNFVADFLDKNKQLEQLYRISYFDNLTGLKNRHSYSLRIQELIKNPPQTLGVVYVDINGLKAINDLQGHKAGDNYIRQLGAYLGELYGQCCFRIGGDEFVSICADITAQDFKSKRNNLHDFIHRGEFPYAAVGISWKEAHCNIAEQIELADRFMYEHKQRQYREYNGKHEISRHKYRFDPSLSKPDL